MEIKIDKELLPTLATRANKLTKYLDKIEDEIYKFDLRQLDFKGLMTVYNLVSRNQMAILEFIRKMMLIPVQESENARIRSLVNRLLALSVPTLKKLENLIQESEIKGMDDREIDSLVFDK